jgi:hypothetical protein
MEGFPMKWQLKLERIDEAGILQSTVVGFIERPELTSEQISGLCRIPHADEAAWKDVRSLRREGIELLGWAQFAPARICPVRIMCTTSAPARVAAADRKDLKPSVDRATRLTGSVILLDKIV